jgi:hypothetical protein
MISTAALDPPDLVQAAREQRWCSGVEAHPMQASVTRPVLASSRTEFTLLRMLKPAAGAPV